VRTLVSTIALIAQLTAFAVGQDRELRNVALIRAHWSAPCEGAADSCGSPAVSYVLQMQFRISGDQPPSEWQTVAEDIPDTFQTVTVPFGVGARGRVAGVDSLGRQGVWSIPGGWVIVDYGPPGMPLDYRWGD